MRPRCWPPCVSAAETSVSPQLDVLVPARNAAATLRAALASIQSQTFRHWRCVVVDDGSSDETAAILASVSAQDGRFHVVSGRGAGIVSALSIGLKQCTAPFVARMDADDLSHRRRFAAQLQLFERDPGLSAVGSHVRLFPTRELSGGMKNYERWLCSVVDASSLQREAFVESPVAHPSLMFRTDTLKLFGYADRGWPEDYDLILRMLDARHRLSVVPERLLYWRESRSRLSRTSPVCAQDRIVACKAHYLAQGFLRDSGKYVLWGYGDTGKQLASALSDHGKTPSLVVELHPGRIGQRICGAPVVHPDALGTQRAESKIIASVAGAGPRQEIRAALDRFGYREGADYVCAA